MAASDNQKFHQGLAILRTKTLDESLNSLEYSSIFMVFFIHTHDKSGLFVFILMIS